MINFFQPPRLFIFALTFTALIAVSSSSQAVLTIEVNRSVDKAIPIAVVPFAWRGDNALDEFLVPAAARPATVIQADLTRSGKFEPLAARDFLSKPSDLKAVNYKDWRLLKAEALVIGTIASVGDGMFEVRFRLLDVFREKQLAGRQFVVKQTRLRNVAHQISDIIYETLLGKTGAFDTRIAYVTVSGANAKTYHLQVADSDGFNTQTILKSPYPILSPAWSPDGAHLAYVSFENKRSTIYLQELWSGAREEVAAHNGINSAPAWSPDGRQLAMTLSREGNPEIYIYNVADKSLRRLTHHTAIDTEAAWAPDGRSIAFTSSRAGSPQIYQISTGDGERAAKRITFTGTYNAGAAFSNDGKSLALITNQGKGFRVGLYTFASRKLSELTVTRHDESPTFSPNDEMVMYATRDRGRDVLAAISVDGKVRHLIRLPDGVVREPAWSPFNQ